MERRICLPIGASIRRDDRILAGLYREALARDPAVAESQRAWLAERDRCASRDPAEQDWCIYAAYERRKRELIARIGAPAWAEAGTTALYVDPGIEFEESFRATPLYRRLLPAISGASAAHLLVTANADGTVAARGYALGEGAQDCSVDARGLRLDPETGWWSAPYRAAGGEPAEWRDRPMPVLLLWSDRAEVYRSGHSEPGSPGDDDPRASEYAGCAVAVSFPEMIRVPVTPDEAARVTGFVDALRGEEE